MAQELMAAYEADGKIVYFVRASALPGDVRMCLMVDGMPGTDFKEYPGEWYYPFEKLRQWAVDEHAKHPEDKSVKLVYEVMESVAKKIADGNMVWVDDPPTTHPG